MEGLKPQQKGSAMDTTETRSTYQAGKDKPCARCGGTFPGYVMEYHHTKDRIGNRKPLRYLTQYCRSTTEEEIPGCEVVCINCHRIIHWTARQETGSEAREDAQAAAWRASSKERSGMKKQRNAKIKEHYKSPSMKEHYKALRVERQKLDAVDILALIPEDKTIPKNELLTLAQGAGVGVNKARDCIKRMISSGQVHVHKIPRPGTNARVELALFAQF